MKNRKSTLIRDISLLHGRDQIWAQERIHEAQKESENKLLGDILWVVLWICIALIAGYFCYSVVTT